MSNAHIYQGEEAVIAEIRRRLKNLRVESTTQVKIDESGESLVLTPVRDENRAADLQAALAKVKNRYSEALKNLAK